MKNIFSIFFTSSASRIYLDHAGATPVSDASRDALIEALSHYGNASAIHREGVEAGRLLDKARVTCAKALNAHAYEISFFSSGTESCNTSIFGVYQGWVKSQKSKVESENANAIPHVITTVIEHPAVLEPIRELEKKGLISVTYVPVDELGAIRLQDIRDALTDETILVSIMYANNEIGTLLPVKEIGRLIEEWKKEHGRTHTQYPYFHIDACQAANYCNLDVLRLRTHLMTVNSSKCYGPKGAALLYKREGIRVDPIIYGGGQERQLRSGTEAVPLIYSFSVALEEANRMRESETKRLEDLNDFCKEKLEKEIPGIIFYGAFDEIRSGKLGENKNKEQISYRVSKRLPNNINCSIPGITSEEMILRLDAQGVAVSHKSACASRESDGSYVILALGKTEKEALENIRITFGRSTTRDDIERLVDAMKIIVEKYKR